MLNASQLGQGWHRLLRRFGLARELEVTAKASGALLRCREIKNAGDLLRLALAYGPCGMSLRVAAAWAETIGLGSLSDVAVMKRPQASAHWVQGIVRPLLAPRFTGAPGGKGGRIIPLADST